MARKLGQHFLKNKKAINIIIDALELQPNETVIEIGPGTGALTLPLLTECKKVTCKLIAIERDEQLAKSLEHRANSNIRILTGDALDLLPSAISHLPLAATYKLVGNIPYYITGSLLRLIGELEYKPRVTVLMIQKEVAERVTAKPPQMNLLAAATQIWADIQILHHLKPSDFDPPPKVDSAIIKLTPVNKSGIDLERYYRCIRAVFKQPRKKLSNNISREILKKAGISPDLRGQNLTIEDLSRLSMLYF